jgi:hypothetical protein
LTPFRVEGITLECREHLDGEIVIALVGTIEHFNPGTFLDPFFAALDAHMLACRAPALVVDFTRLAFLNSSGIKSLIRWVMRVAGLPTAERYALRFDYTSAITWQYASFQAVGLLARGAVAIMDRRAKAA